MITRGEQALSTINSPKTRLMIILKKQFPQMRTAVDIADVIFAGEEINAIDQAHRQKRWVWFRKGAKAKAFNNARRYRLIDKKETELKAYFEYKRPNHPPVPTVTDKLKALQLERKGLFAHMLANPKVRDVIVKELSLPTNNLNSIARIFETGNLYDQLKVYGKVFTAITSARLYEKRYDYYMIGYRNVPHHYWLSKLALKLLEDSK